MTGSSRPQDRRRFMLGVVLISLSYVLWGGMLVFGAIAVRWPTGPWLRLAAGVWLLNWVAFIVGILVAGREAARFVRRKALGVFSRRGKGPGAPRARGASRG